MAKLVPPWIENLKSGEYTVKELSESLGLCNSIIARMLLKYGARRSAKRDSYRNLVTFVYHWDGYNTKK